ncbi:MAG TPA: peptidylprolyl isomerase [Lacipirellulaceae bacterium]|nr:peptidylprolyl isomerase [Lacipirellulaceae bacterium]
MALNERSVRAGGAPRPARPWLPGVLGLAALCGGADLARANQFVQLQFNLSTATRSRNAAFIEVFDDKPLTSANFMAYVNGGAYDGSMMHRLSRNFVLQGGGFYPEFLTEPPPVSVSLDPSAEVDLDGNPATANPMVMNEYSVGTVRSNVRGTLAMARVGGQPNSADSQWFVNWGNNSSLDSVDGGFTVFAQVVGDGMTGLFDVYNSGLGITNLNPDTNDDGVRNGGPFGMNANDGVPFVNSTLLVLDTARRIDYFGAGSSTNVGPGGLTISTRDAYIDSGAAFTGAGGVTIGGGRTLGMREGFSLTRSLNNFGALALGLQVGAVTVASYQQGAGGTLDIDIRGTTVDAQYDRLNVTGAAALAGTLNVEFLGSFAGASGDEFTILTAGSISGSFAAMDLPSLGASQFWRQSQTSAALSLAIVGGDFDHSGTVNAADLSVWRGSFGTAVTAFSAGDGNGDGTVDGNDFIIWQRGLGLSRTGPGATAALAAVPEPGGAYLAALGAVAALARLRRGRRS